MNGLLVCLALTALGQAPDTTAPISTVAEGPTHRMGIGFEVVHWSRVHGAHHGESIDETGQAPAGLSLHYAWVAAPWFELGGDVSMGRTYLDDRHETIHALRTALTARFVLPLADGRVGLSLMGAGGLSTHWFRADASVAALILGALGVRWDAAPHFTLWTDLRTSTTLVALTPTGSSSRLSLEEQVRLEALLGFGWGF